jgi:hypothetical protein
MSIEREIELLALEDEQRGQLTRRGLAVLQFRKQRRLLDAYATVFCGSADSQTLTPEGALVLADLGRLAGLGRARIKASDAELRMSEGQRHVVLHIIDHVRDGGRKLARLARQIRETDT